MLKKSDSKIVATVVIPCYNGIRTMEPMLDSVLKQEMDFPFNVLVIDSSDDGTDSMIRNRFPQVQLIHLPRQTYPGSGRNLGVREAVGEIIAFTDSDCILPSDWLQKIVDRHRELDCEAVGGAVINGYQKHYIAWVSHLIEFNEWTTSTRSGFVKNIPTCNLSYKRKMFFDYGIEFCDNFPTEDTIFNWRLTSNGGRIYFDPDIRVIHLNRMTFRKLFVHQYRLGKAVAIERQITDLPGKILLKVPILGLGIPFVRWGLVLVRMMKCGLKWIFLFIAISPLFFLASIAWTIGFMVKGKPREAVIHLHDKKGSS